MNNANDEDFLLHDFVDHIDEQERGQGTA